MTSRSESINVRVNRRTHHSLTALARENGLSLQTILDRAVEAYRRQSFLESLNSDFAALRANSGEWAEEIEERKLWEQTLADGQDQE